MIGFALMLLASSAAPDPGPAPQWNEAVALGEAAIRSRLIDPESARIQWPYDFFGGSIKGNFSKRQIGWISCGLVNSKNRLGGYAGDVPFLIVINNYHVSYLAIGDPQGLDTASATCPSLIQQGLIRSSGALGPPNSPGAQMTDQAAVASAEVAAKQGGLGIAFSTSRAGLVLLAVAPGSPADLAGLRPGQVIQAANGIDLREMPQAAAIAVLKALPPAAQIELAGGGKVSLIRP